MRQLWGYRSPWELRFRWMVGPLIGAFVAGARLCGFELAVWPILGVAAAFPVYNAVLFVAYRMVAGVAGRAAGWAAGLETALLLVEVLVDYFGIFVLIHLTGGVRSPLTLFLIFHVILAAMQFSGWRAFLYSSWAGIGLWMMLWLESSGGIVSPPVTYQGEPILFAEGYASSTVRVAFLTVTIFLCAFLVRRIMARLQRGVAEVERTSTQLAGANEKLASLYAIVRAMGVERRLQATLDLAATQLASIFEDTAVGITLLQADGQSLRFAAHHGLPEGFVRETRVERRRVPFHDRVLHGETVVEGRIQLDPFNPLRSTFAAIGIRSVALAPLEIEGRVLGTLGLYSKTEDRFRGIDASFLEITAELVAIAIEDARANEAVDAAMHDRTRLMLQVAHNLRAPLGASLGLLDLVASGQAGPLAPKAQEHVARIMDRLRSLDQMVSELLQIAQSRDWAKEIPDVMVAPAELASQIRRIFADEAAAKQVSLRVHEDADLPDVESGGELLLRVVENLVSNALKYTPSGGEVEVRFESRSGGVRIVVRDTGIGIPAAEQGQLFTEFFRASNAKRHARSGTGLGLTFVKHAVERHRGHLFLCSQEGEGTTVVIDLYARRPPPEEGHTRVQLGLPAN